MGWGGDIFIFERMVFKIINYMLCLVKEDFHFTLLIKFYFARITTMPCNIDLGTDHLTLTQNKEKQIILGIWNLCFFKFYQICF